MKGTSFLMRFSIILLIIAGALLIFEPTTRVQEPDPRFDVESSRFVNGSAEFLYIPADNETHNVVASYETSRDSQILRYVKNQERSGISRENPIRVIIEAEPKDMVAVEMNIADTEGNLLHNSTLSMEGTSENQ